ncbi:MAG: 1-(5-phosphoribosyl)-5-[(5-phosphoribosylamino)methylideneamino]imidazole-4-carboxamide isomerase [Legionellales bacterium]
MLIIPAIDLQAGRCVRLKQGRFDEVTQFDNIPIERAQYFAQLGAKRLHVVDLDGAKNGSMQQLPLICAMQKMGIPVQAGGGIRSIEQARLCMNAGLSNLVIGSLAITNPVLTLQIIQEIGANNITLALDVRMENNHPKPATHGWQTTSETNLWELVAYFQQQGIRQVLCTDIACDGMMSGPNFNLYQQAAERFPSIEWQASGGIRHQADIAKLKSLGIAAVILGLTLYQGDFNLSDCLNEYNLC